MPIIGITASSITPYTLGDFQSIATVSVTTATQANVEFTNIPQTYQHLQIRAIARNGTGIADANLQVNSDTGSNYAYHLLVGNRTNAQAFNGINQTSMRGPGYSDQTASIFGAGITDILDYANTNKYKTVRTLTGLDTNGGTYNQIQFYSGLWQSTSAITSIKITPSAGSFAQYSHFALYGIRG